MTGYRCLASVSTRVPDRGARGMTLIELLVSLAVTGMLLVIGVPSFEALANSKNVQGQTDEFRQAIQRARQEAFSRSQPVTVCRRVSGSGSSSSSSTSSCASGSPSAWEDGWLVFVDRNDDGSRDSDEKIIRVKQGLRDDYTLRPSSSNPVVRFQPDGGLSSSYTFRLCGPDGVADDGKKLRINIAGRVNTDGSPARCK